MVRILVIAEEKSAENYVYPLQRAGFCVCVQTYPEKFDPFDCVLFGGGGDIDSKRFGKNCFGTSFPDFLRDECEFRAFRHFFSRGRTIFGICRGMQLINVALGGTLVCDLETKYSHAWCGKDMHHMTSICENSLLYNLYGRKMRTNSAHHQGIDCLGKGLYATQMCQDGVCEAIEHENGRIFGFQWHPERMTGKFENRELFEDTQGLFCKFFEIVQKNMQK